MIPNPTATLSYDFIIHGVVSLFPDRDAFAWCSWSGAFPVAYDPDRRRFSTSARGLLVAAVYASAVALQIRGHAALLLYGSAKKTSAVSATVRTVHALGLLALLVRRIACVRDTVRCYNGLAEWPAADAPVRRSYALVSRASAAAVLVEFVGDNVARYVST